MMYWTWDCLREDENQVLTINTTSSRWSLFTRILLTNCVMINWQGRMCWHHFLEKHVKKSKEKQPMKTECNRLIEEREKVVNRTHRWSEEFNSTNGLASQPIGRWSTEGSANREKEASNQGDMPKRKAQRRRVNPWLAMGHNQF
jgi:hypothetical protein